MNNKFKPLPEETERIGKAVVNAAYQVHQGIGPGAIESIYEVCFCHELSKAKLSFERQAPVPVVYDGIRFDAALRPDIVVASRIICELKAVEIVLPVHRAQILSYLKMTQIRLGFLINFNVSLIKDGIERFVI